MSSVFINKRAIRFAFLVNPQNEDWSDRLDAICEYNLDKWCGRFNPVIPTDGSKVTPDWWRFLKKFDPDYIIATSTISDELRDKLKAEICPIDVELPKPNQPPFGYNEPIFIAPTPQTLAKLSRVPFPLPPLPQMANLYCDYTADDIVRKFLIRNFGSYPNIVYWNSVLDKIPHLDFPLANKADLISALSELSRPELKIVYPIQVSALNGPTFYLDYEQEHSYDVFGLIVGDTFQEQLFSWNKVFYCRTDNQTHRLNHLWLPMAFANDAEFMEALGGWLRRMTEYVHLFSFSVSNEELSVMGESLDATRDSKFVLRSPLHTSVTAIAKFPFPKFGQAHTFSFWDRFSHALSPPKEADHYRASALSEEFEINGPTMGQELQPRGSWIADVFIEADKNRFYDEKIYLRQDSSFWWQLPRKNYLATQIFGVKARIDSRGVPAIQLPVTNPRLRFQLPDERQLLRSCVLGDVYGRMSGQVKRRLDIDEVDPSNIGKYLSGFLEVFGGLAAAHSVLSERYWRTVFDLLSGRDSAKDSNLLEQVRGKLRRKITSYLTKTEMLNNFENLAEYVVQLSREVASEGAAKEFSTFQKEARKEHGEFQREEGVDWEFDENAVRNNMSRLLEIGVLQMGCNQGCPRCGTVTWFPVGEVRQSVVCAGCRYEFAIPAEPTLSYRLSTLARQGIFAHGLVPVVLVLGQLLNDSRSSFFLSPSLDLFKLKSDEPRRYERLTDLDIVCIKDGKFVIGEIKTNQARFELEQSLKMADIAEAIGADILLFSSLETEQTNATKEMIDKVKERLKASKVEVGWYQLAEVFRPSRMDY